MKKKVLATACLMSLAVSQAAFADDYVTGDSRYAAPDFQEQKQEREAGVIKDKSKKKKQAESAEPMPITLWSDSATYDQGSGDFFAEGNVKIVQGDETILTTRAEGNMKTGDVWLKQGGTLQEPDTTMNGEWVHYNLIPRPVRSSKLTAKVPKTILKHRMQRFIRIK